jgi:hypothetical protein
VARNSRSSGSSGASSPWPDVEFTQDPRLLVGWRDRNKRLNAKRFRLDQDVFEDLRALCRPALELLQTATEREYEESAELEPNEEFFSYDISDLPAHPPPTTPQSDDEPGATDDETADLVRLVRTVDALDEVTREDVNIGGYSFYAICWPLNGSMVGFVSKVNPMATLRTGFRYFQFANTLRRVDRPEVALRDGSDIVIAPNRLAIIRPSAFNLLLGDVGIAFKAVPSNLKVLEAVLQTKIALTPEAAQAVRTEASRRVSYARRLRALPSRIELIANLDETTVRANLLRHDVKPSLLLDDQGRWSFDVEHVGVFLDVIEGRYFEDELSGDKRRADRFSTRGV